MRFARLHIPAFGPFTNLDLRFPSQNGDFHVIYGSNEAGKSSLLRAFRDLLFGIHGQSPDNFLHDYKELRITGEIANRAGEKLIFQRRKGNKNTLLDADGQPLPDHALSPFLGSIDLAYFSTMFGLGARELREGAEQLLRGEGDIGEALFSASLGGTPVQLVLAALTAESDRLFKGRSTANVSIRPTTNRYKDLLRQSRDAVVSSETWEKIERDLAAAEETKSKLEGEISVFTRNLEWICRCEDALPAVGRLGEEMRRLELLPPMPDVSSDFVERARACRQAAGESQAEVTSLTSQLGKLAEQLAGCQITPALLAEADALDRLHQDLGVYRDRHNSLTDLKTELAGIEAVLRAGMLNLELTGNFSTLETLRLNSGVRLTCEEAADGLLVAVDDLEKNIAKTEELKTQIGALDTQLQALPETDLTDLRNALSAAAGATEANRTLLASESEVNRLNHEATDRHRELTGAPKDLDTTGSLSVPSKATIRRMGEELDGINRDIKTEESKILVTKKHIENLQAELVRMERRGELPSEQALHKAREHRDHGWSLVLADWKGHGSKEEFVHGISLEEAFPQTIVQTDNIADQLRAQAEAVAQAEEKRIQIDQSEKQNQDSKEIITALQDRFKECQLAWETAWLPGGITPRMPAEMEEWREDWSEFKVLLRQLRTAEGTLQQKSTRIQEAKIQLATALSEPVEKEFRLLNDEAIRRVQQGEQSAGRRIEVTNQLQGLKAQWEPFARNKAGLATAVEVATKKWEAQCRTVGLPEKLSPKSGLVLLQERKELLAKFDRWKEVSTISKKTKDAVEHYEQTINEKAVALGARGDTAEAQEIDLWKMLDRARTAQTRHEQLIDQSQEAEIALGKSQESNRQAAWELEEIIRLAGLETVAALEPLLANLELRDQAQRQIATLRDTLGGLARGQAVDDFLARIREEDVETLPQRKVALQTRKQEMEAGLQTVRDTWSELKGKRQTLEAAGDAAANYRQLAESCAARLKQDAARFVRLRLAAHFLQAQIERFRKENQGSLLAKSGQVFAEITRGTFSGLGAEFNADDTPILVGLRPDRSSVPLTGMSDGSRDQLYLALRLAALDQYLEKHEPMPLILDDLLITFDDDRATAILPQLSALAQRTQIFLFTHHDHLVELCRRTFGNDTFHLHRLN